MPFGMWYQELIWNISPAKLSADYDVPLERVEKIKQEVYG